MLFPGDLLLSDHERPETHRRQLRPHLVGLARGSPLRRSSPFPLMDARSLPVNGLNIASHAPGLPLHTSDPIRRPSRAASARLWSGSAVQPFATNAKLLTKQ